MNAPQTMVFFRQVEADTISAKARELMIANEQSPVVYLSIDGHNITYRLKSGDTFRLTRREAKPVGPGRWHL